MRRSRYLSFGMALLAGATVALAQTPDDAPASVRRLSHAAAEPAAPGVVQGSNALAMSTQWERMPGCAERISIAALTQIWVIGCSPDLDSRIFRWQEGGWQMDSRSAHSIAAVSELPTQRNKFLARVAGVATVSNDGLVAFENHPLPVRFREVASGGGWMWAILQPVGDHTGGLVVRSDGLPESTDCSQQFGAADMGLCTDYAWSAPFGQLYATRLGVGLTDATAWAIGEDGRIYKQVMQGDGWEERPGCAVAIANAGKDNVWVIGCDAPDSEGNHGIYRWNGESWITVPGRGVEIALQSDGTAWLLTADGGIWRHRTGA
jgi:hypothetical protein